MGLFCLPATFRAAAQESSPETASHKSTKHKTTKKSGNSSKSSSKKGSSSKASSGKHSRGKSRGRKRGQQAIDSERAREIQQALIREHYMDGAPSGHWDAATEAALRRFQGAQGWQTKTVPDSRALIKLGLGPSKDGLLNPESAMTTVPATSQKSDPSSNPASENKPQP
jgi:hypothetical protein